MMPVLMYLLHLTAVQTYCILQPYSLGHCFMLRVRCRRQRQGHGLREVQELHPSMYAAGSRLVESRVLRDDSTCQEMGHGLVSDIGNTQERLTETCFARFVFLSFQYLGEGKRLSASELLNEDFMSEPKRIEIQTGFKFWRGFVTSLRGFDKNQDTE